MRILVILLFLLLAAYTTYPYVNVYFLNNALQASETTQLEALLDMPAIQANYRAQVDLKPSQFTDAQSGKGNLLSDVINSVGNAAVNQMTKIDAQWVKTCLQQRSSSKGTLWSTLDFAFFESPTRFIARIGSLGEEPVFVQMNLQNWSWRVTAVYDCGRLN